ncbi:MAG: MBL fold metallo-hydrolase [Micrococcales bacterium]|nr:MBL fold metallo-hydrolase [Micrococcales bacterium]
MTETAQITQVVDGVHFVSTALANWVVLTDGDDVALVDCGYPVHLPLVRASVRAAVGHDAPVGTLLVTHAHADHIGPAARLVAEDGTQVRCSPTELAGVRREEKYQVDIGDIARHPRLSVLRWTARAVRAGGLRDVAVAAATVLDGPEVIAGHRVEPLDIPGHTPGHLAYWLPQVRVLVTGDALVTGHPLLPDRGPQMLHPMFHQDLDRATKSLERFVGLDARWVLPGHGDLLCVGPDAPQITTAQMSPEVLSPSAPVPPLSISSLDEAVRQAGS